MNVIPSVDPVISAICRVAEREGWGAQSLLDEATRCDFTFDDPSVIRRALKGYDRVSYGSSSGMTGRGWSAAIGLIHHHKPESHRRALVLFRAKKLPTSESNIAEALHAAGRDGLPESVLPQMLAALNADPFAFEPEVAQ